MDRERARAVIKSGMIASSLALLVFALAFYVAVLYLAMSQPQKPTESIYLPRPSVAPALVALRAVCRHRGPLRLVALLGDRRLHRARRD